MKKLLWLLCGLGVTCAIATALVADKKSDTTPDGVAELKRQISALQDKAKTLEDKLGRLEQSKNPPGPKSPLVVIQSPNGQRKLVIPGKRGTLSGYFANPEQPPKIWGEGECNGWKYYVIPLSCEVARN
jgi:hypothetical protein